MTEERRPKDMTAEELAALPEIEDETLVLLTQEDIERGMRGRYKRVIIKRLTEAHAYDPDDIIVWQDKEGIVWSFERHDGIWHKRRSTWI